MSLLEKVKSIVAEQADGHHHALLAIAEAIDNGAARVDVDKLKHDVVQDLHPTVADAVRTVHADSNVEVSALQQRIEALSLELGALRERFMPPPASDAPAPNHPRTLQMDPATLAARVAGEFDPRPQQHGSSAEGGGLPQPQAAGNAGSPT